MGNSKEFARKKGLIHKFDFSLDLIWITKDNHYKVGNFVLIHCMNHSKTLGSRYFSCENTTDLNNIKSLLLNNGFKLDWAEFNGSMEWLNG